MRRYKVGSKVYARVHYSNRVNEFYLIVKAKIIDIQDVGFKIEYEFDNGREKYEASVLPTHIYGTELEAVQAQREWREGK